MACADDDLHHASNPVFCDERKNPLAECHRLTSELPMIATILVDNPWEWGVLNREEIIPRLLGCRPQQEQRRLAGHSYGVG